MNELPWQNKCHGWILIQARILVPQMLILMMFHPLDPCWIERWLIVLGATRHLVIWVIWAAFLKMRPANLSWKIGDQTASIARANIVATPTLFEWYVDQWFGLTPAHMCSEWLTNGEHDPVDLRSVSVDHLRQVKNHAILETCRSIANDVAKFWKNNERFSKVINITLNTQYLPIEQIIQCESNITKIVGVPSLHQ